MPLTSKSGPLLLSVSEFIAHFHPVLVHLPIGILLIAILLQWLSYSEKFEGLGSAIPIVLLCGAASAIVSCITGFLLTINDDYDKTLVNWHMWMGFGVALTSIILYVTERYPQFKINKKILSIALLGLISMTGHLGGSLTHGSDYLTSPLDDIFGSDSLSKTSIQPIANIQEALVYNDVIKPIFQTRCYSCHGPNKQKGKLRMDDVMMLMKGGEDGKVIEPGNADSSELIKRLLLPVDNDDHMPPREKPQLSENQVALLHWWIANRADFEKKVKALEQSDKIKPVLLALQKTPEIKEEITGIPTAPVEKADDKIIEQLKGKGIVILPVTQNSNYLLANFVTNTMIKNEHLRLLQSLKNQLIWLKLGYTTISDSNLVDIAQFENLTRLSLERTVISDIGLQQLKKMQKLEYLNLVGTKVTTNGVLQLKELKTLRSIYLFQTGVNHTDWVALQNAFPKTKIDSGGYTVARLANDTIEIKP